MEWTRILWGYDRIVGELGLWNCSESCSSCSVVSILGNPDAILHRAEDGIERAQPHRALHAGPAAPRERRAGRLPGVL
jgi:hypothetical protein